MKILLPFESFEKPTAQQEKKTTQLNMQLLMSTANVDLKHSFQQEHIPTQILFAFNLKHDSDGKNVPFHKIWKEFVSSKHPTTFSPVRAVHETE